ncbi:MAG: hypothetical protein ACYSWZ_05640 [Planctomycetota bacterium]
MSLANIYAASVSEAEAIMLGILTHFISYFMVEILRIRDPKAAKYSQLVRFHMAIGFNVCCACDGNGECNACPKRRLYYAYSTDIM